MLTAISEQLGIENIIDLTVSIDKLEKIGWEGVEEELRGKGISEEAISRLKPILGISGSNEEKLEKLADLFRESEVGRKGVEELTYILDKLRHCRLQNEVRLDLSLARGLDYYTGTIFEVKALDTPMGSITGGGRYDNLTGVFGQSGMSGVGISFGAERIFDVLEALDLYPESTHSGTQLLFINFGEKALDYILPLLGELRSKGITAEVYPDDAKMKKQMSYANALSIPYVAFVGDDEIEQHTISVKDMESGEQKSYTAEELITLLRS